MATCSSRTSSSSMGFPGKKPYAIPLLKTAYRGGEQPAAWSSTKVSTSAFRSMISSVASPLMRKRTTSSGWDSRKQPTSLLVMPSIKYCTRQAHACYWCHREQTMAASAWRFPAAMLKPVSQCSLGIHPVAVFSYFRQLSTCVSDFYTTIVLWFHRCSLYRCQSVYVPYWFIRHYEW